MAWGDWETEQAASEFREVLQKYEISLEQLSEFSGISVTKIQDIKMGHYDPDREEWKLLGSSIEKLRPQQTSRKWIPVKSASQLSGKSERTLYRWISEGFLESFKTGGVLFVDLREVVEAKKKRGKSSLETPTD